MVLVTGGCGFIGSHLCEALAENGRKVRVFDDFSSGRIENIRHLGDAVEVVNGDIRDKAGLEAAMAGVSRVFHLAALVQVFESIDRPEKAHDINITGTFNVMEAARRAKAERVVFASSCSVYGESARMPKTEDMVPSPCSPYAASKLAGEHYLSVYSHLYGVPSVSLRFFNVFGPRQDPSSPYSGVISRFSQAVRRGEAPVIFGDGLQTRDFVYVKDVVRALMSAMFEPGVGYGEVYNVGAGVEISLLDVIAAFEKVLKKEIKPEFRDARVGDLRRMVADMDLARERLGFAPAFSFERGLEEVLLSA